MGEGEVFQEDEKLLWILRIEEEMSFDDLEDFRLPYIC